MGLIVHTTSWLNRTGLRGDRPIAAAVCCRWEDSWLRLGLVSTSDGGRWTFPKGHREPGETLAGAAAREALEEAGVVGRLDRRCLLTYRHPARGGGENLVSAFLLHVTAVPQAPEAPRELVWCDAKRARRLLGEGREQLHVQELERVLDAALKAAAASRERAFDRGPGRLARRIARTGAPRSKM